jgi:hypothetical protein
MKKLSPSSGQNGQLVHWWLLVRSSQFSHHNLILLFELFHIYQSGPVHGGSQKF